MPRKPNGAVDEFLVKKIYKYNVITFVVRKSEAIRLTEAVLQQIECR